MRATVAMAATAATCATVVAVVAAVACSIAATVVATVIVATVVVATAAAVGIVAVATMRAADALVTETLLRRPTPHLRLLRLPPRPHRLRRTAAAPRWPSAPCISAASSRRKSLVRRRSVWVQASPVGHDPPIAEHQAESLRRLGFFYARCAPRREPALMRAAICIRSWHRPVRSTRGANQLARMHVDRHPQHRTDESGTL